MDTAAMRVPAYAGCAEAIGTKPRRIADVSSMTTSQRKALKRLSSTTNDFGAIMTAKKAMPGPKPSRAWPKKEAAAIRMLLGALLVCLGGRLVCCRSLLLLVLHHNELVGKYVDTTRLSCLLPVALKSTEDHYGLADNSKL